MNAVINVAKFVKRIGRCAILKYQRKQSLAKFERLKKSPNFKEGSLAIHTVFIMHENILWLEDWIIHHLAMGADHIFLYDNSRVQRKSVEHIFANTARGKKMTGVDLNPNKVNRHGCNYAEVISVEDAQKKYTTILEKYREFVTMVPWEMRYDNGDIGHFQPEAIKAFVASYGHIYDYCLHIDVDEFMVSRNGLNFKDIVQNMHEQNISTFYFNSRLFSSRFNYVGAPISSIVKSLPVDRDIDGQKSMFKMSAVTSEYNIHWMPSLFSKDICPNDDMLFYHYCHNSEVTLVEYPDAPKLLKC